MVSKIMIVKMAKIIGIFFKTLTFESIEIMPSVGASSQPTPSRRGSRPTTMTRYVLVILTDFAFS